MNMKTLYTVSSIKTILAILLIAFFGVFYWQTVMSLPLFGDATIHAFQANLLLKKDWRALSADYPSHYYFLMATLSSLVGEYGYNLVPYVGFIFLLLCTYLLIKQLTNNYYLSLLAILFAGCSPKIIFYSARMYQEILISAFFIYSIFLLFKYQKKRNQKILLLLSFFVGITLSIKQQGLFILYPSITIFYCIEFIRKRVSFLRILLITIIPILIGIPFYGVLFHTTGELQPGSNEFAFFRSVNSIGSYVFAYKDKTQHKTLDKNIKDSTDIVIENSLVRPNANNLIENELSRIEEKHSTTGYKRAEKRHLWPIEIFTNFEKFNQANNLYINTQGKDLENPYLEYFFFFLLIAGFFYCIYKYKNFTYLLTFSLVFLPINYILFSRNTDQQRYHLFLPIFLLCYIFSFLNIVLKKSYIRENLKVIIIILCTILPFIPILEQRILINKWWSNTQIYSSSTGGISSVKEAGKWVKNNTSENTLIGQTCGNETGYYSDRNVVGDWRIYFLDSRDLKEYFRQQKISYYVIYESQIVDDKKWAHICWMPNSFYQKIDSNFKKVYITSTKDIYIYETD
jgi:hypothetical protein